MSQIHHGLSRAVTVARAMATHEMGMFLWRPLISTKAMHWFPADPAKAGAASTGIETGNGPHTWVKRTTGVIRELIFSATHFGKSVKRRKCKLGENRGHESRYLRTFNVMSTTELFWRHTDCKRRTGEHQILRVLLKKWIVNTKRTTGSLWMLIPKML